jgi:hypothetical protein
MKSNTHKNTAKSQLVYNEYEHCELTDFHVEAINKNYAKIRITPEVIFS